MSYSFYLNHLFVVAVAIKVCQSVGMHFTNFNHGLIFALLICLPLVTIMSAMTYYLIERPFLMLRRSYLKPLPVEAEVARPTAVAEAVATALPR